MQVDPELNQVNQAVTPVSIESIHKQNGLVRCPNCGSTQFFGRRKITGWGWFWLISAIGNLLISIPLMAACIGFAMIFLSPIMAFIGWHVCRTHVNTCAKCKQDF